MQIAITSEIETILLEYAGSRKINPEMLVQNVLKEWFDSRIVPKQSDGNNTLDHIDIDAFLKEGYQATRQESLKLAKEFEAGFQSQSRPDSHS